MRIVTQLLTGLVFLVVGALILMHFMPGSATLARQVGVPETMIHLVARETPTAKAPEEGNRRGGNRDQTVVVKAAEKGKINDSLRAIGDGDAARSVAVTPLVSGQIAELMVKSGQRVKAGDVIATLDDDVEKIATQTAKVALQAATNKMTRNEDLKKIISQADYQDTQTAVETARLVASAAELALQRRIVRAPIDGIAGIVNVEIGDYVTVSTPLVTLDDRSKLLVDFWVPERFTGLIKEGQEVAARPIARPGKSFPGKIEAIDNRIDPASRTLHVRAVIENQGDDLRAGQSFEVVVNLPGDMWPSVSPLAIQWDSTGSYVWRVNADKKVERVSAAIIQRNQDDVLVDGDVKPGDRIVIEGLQQLKAGATVKIFGEDKKNDKVADAEGTVKP
ncbi:efflux RND transporter periplasmic adaptor subunit [Rhizobium sp. TH2]|uniref:efflux RND transporter periplasmic adaptor subunit n=1 Tax=Rhizobium sp. TH2 TaxID=2775403 RepID=UPI002156FA98|nr:efflux RND transporter periplasmic adaptor subunit [Rhizobium sp. TH2]UVC06734.1 efflux RND transporter periplasmic adaptor subunit [Rhizobium sp. TH2]